VLLGQFLNFSTVATPEKFRSPRFTWDPCSSDAAYPTRIGISISSGVSEPCRPTSWFS